MHGCSKGASASARVTNEKRQQVGAEPGSGTGAMRREGSRQLSSSSGTYGDWGGGLLGAGPSEEHENVMDDITTAAAAASQEVSETSAAHILTLQFRTACVLPRHS